MIEFNTETEAGKRLEQGRKRAEAQVARDTVLTTTIPSEEYRRMVERLLRAEDLARCVADDWVNSAGFSFNEPSQRTKDMLHLYDRGLYFQAEVRVREAKEQEKARQEETT